MTPDDVIAYFDSLSNWGRWGSDDRLGTLNLITDSVRLGAASLIHEGSVVSLSRDIDPLDPDPLKTGLAVVQRFMQIGEAKHHLGDSVRFDGLTEYVGISCHGSNTHLDGLAHYSWDGKHYNGVDVSETTTIAGSKLSVHDASDGIVSRGILLDIAALHSLDWLEPGHPIMPDELEAAAERQGITPRAGDVLLFHTGQVRRVLSEGASQRQSGLHAACLPLLREWDIAALGSDCIQDVQPSGFNTIDLMRPIHAVGLVALGLWLIDNMELTELAAVCAEKKRWEFFFTMLPWRFVGVTSSATNPIAIF
jgi:kynurenine formamidase